MLLWLAAAGALPPVPAAGVLTSELERCGLLACAIASALEARILLQTHESVGGAAELLWLLELSAALRSTLLALPLLLAVLVAAAGVVVLAVRVFLPPWPLSLLLHLAALAALAAAACSATLLLLLPLALALLLELLLAGPAAHAVRQSAPIML